MNRKAKPCVPGTTKTAIRRLAASCLAVALAVVCLVPRKILARMKNLLHNLMERAPGLENKTLMGLGIGKLYDDDPSVDYPAFVTEQVRLMAQDPELRKLQGVGFFAPHYTDRPTMLALDKATAKYLTPRR